MRKLSKKKLLLVEGKDDKAFFKKIFEKFFSLNEVQIIDMEGFINLKRELKAILEDDKFPLLEKFLIVVDADESKIDRYNEVKKAVFEIFKNDICNVNLNLNCKFGVLILPLNKSTGSLEDLLVDLMDEKIANIIEEYSLKLENIWNKKNHSKFNTAKYKVFSFLGYIQNQDLYNIIVKLHRFIDYKYRFFNFKTEEGKELINILAGFFELNFNL